MNRASRPTETVEEIKSALRVLREIRESLTSDYDRRLMTTAISVLTDATAVAGEPQAAKPEPMVPAHMLPRPKFGGVGTRDVDIAAAQRAWDEAHAQIEAGIAATPTDAEIRSLWQTTDTGDIEDDIMTFARALVSLQAGKPQDRAEGS